jgi:polysaccharide deacetylase family protein (PEP-CTERM system associated)
VNDQRPPRRHLLSFDVEEYFQVEAAAARVPRDRWPSFEKRLAPALERILTLLADRGAGATFFVVGWVARHEPELVRRIAAAGHEIASHGMDHRMLTRLSPETFREGLRESRRLLEDLAAGPVVGYRAPTFSITRRTAWALDVLAEEGFAYDSSIFPVRHDRYGVEDAPAAPHVAHGPGGGSLLEVPPLTLRLAGRNWPVGGGGYLRLLPVQLLGHALRRAAREGRPGTLYLHPWEFDPDQPVLPMTPFGRWRHRVNLRRTGVKLRWLLSRFRFGPIGDAVPDLRDGAPAHAYAPSAEGGTAEQPTA